MDKRRLNDGPKLLKDQKDNYTVELDPEDTTKFTVELKGPDNSAYKGYWFKLSVELEDGYPNQAPTINFETEILHPNVDKSSGAICHPYLGEKWTPEIQLSYIVDYVIPDMLSEPNPSSPYNADDIEIDWLFKMPEEDRVKAIQEHCEKNAIKK